MPIRPKPEDRCQGGIPEVGRCKRKATRSAKTAGGISIKICKQCPDKPALPYFHAEIYPYLKPM